LLNVGEEFDGKLTGGGGTGQRRAPPPAAARRKNRLEWNPRKIPRLRALVK
jgi:hypothetical protein